MFRVQRYQMIEVPINSTTASQFSIPDQPQLTGHDGTPVVIDSIVSYSAFNFDYSPVSGLQTIGVSNLNKFSISIFQGDLQIINSLPLQEINYVNAPANNFSGGVIQQPLLRNLINVSWTKSFLKYTDPGNANPLTSGTVICLGVYYSVYPSMDFMVPSKENILLQAIDQNTQAIKQFLTQ